jgi:hypothetical protein
MKNYKGILIAIGSFAIFFSVMNGSILNYVSFDGTLNEIAVAVISLAMGFVGLILIDYKKLLIALN